MRLPSPLLERTLVPLLSDDETCCAAARLLGRAEIAGAAPALEMALARTACSDARLEILGALIFTTTFTQDPVCAAPLSVTVTADSPHLSNPILTSST